MLELHDAAIRVETQLARDRLIKTSAGPERALRYFLVFSEPGVATRAGLGTFGDAELFYNRYYWFKRFAKLHQAAHGYDAGIEDQASQLLEHAPPDADWSTIEAIVELLDSTED
jgi:hypothetical protein